MKLFSIGNEKNPIEGNLQEYEGRRTIDIRQWYIERKTGELSPTKKGITLTKDKFYQVMSELSDNSDRIKEWFAFNTDKTRIANDFDEESRESSLVSKQCFDKNMYCEIKSMGPSQLFELEVFGANSCLSINSDSPLGIFFENVTSLKKFSPNDLGDESAIFFVRFLVAFAKAQHRICSDETLRSSVDFVEDIELECKRMLIDDLKKK